MSLRHAILALLDVEPGTGYDLMTRFRSSVGFFWHAGHQQVYKELHALLDDGLVDCDDQAQTGRPSRKVYSLTDAGLATFDDWLHHTVTPMKIRDPLLVKMFAGRRLPKPLLAAELAKHRAVHQQTLTTYHQLEALIDAMPPRKQARYLYPRQTLRMGVHFEQAWLNWCSETEERLGLPAVASGAATPKKPRIRKPAP